MGIANNQFKEFQNLWNSKPMEDRFRHAVRVEWNKANVATILDDVFSCLTDWASKICLTYGYEPTDIKLIAQEFDWGTELGAAASLEVKRTGTWNKNRFLSFLCGNIEFIQRQREYAEAEVHLEREAKLLLEDEIVKIVQGSESIDDLKKRLREKYHYLLPEQDD